MSNKKIQYFYFKIKFRCAEIGQIGLPKKIIQAAKEHNEEKIREVFEQFKSENRELWTKISKLYKEYEYAKKPAIFRNEKNSTENKGLFRYDASKIDPLNLVILFALSNGSFYERYVWKDNSKILQDALIDEGYPKIAEFIETRYIWSIYDLIYVFET